MPTNSNLDKVRAALPGTSAGIAKKLKLNNSTVWKWLNVLIDKDLAYISKHLKLDNTSQYYYEVGPKPEGFKLDINVSPWSEKYKRKKMNPWQLAKAGSEHAEQTALFCFLAKAQRYGFEHAMNPDNYRVSGFNDDVIPELRWVHAIPNGGSRGDDAKSRSIEGGRMKAEGVKSGVHDICWPLGNHAYSGLYIEMKRRSLKRELDPHHGCSDEQKDFGQFVHDNGFYVRVAYGWEEAAMYIREYYRMARS